MPGPPSSTVHRHTRSYRLTVRATVRKTRFDQGVPCTSLRSRQPAGAPQQVARVRKVEVGEVAAGRVAPVETPAHGREHPRLRDQTRQPFRLIPTVELRLAFRWHLERLIDHTRMG